MARPVAESQVFCKSYFNPMELRPLRIITNEISRDTP